MKFLSLLISVLFVTGPAMAEMNANSSLLVVTKAANTQFNEIRFQFSICSPEGKSCTRLGKQSSYSVPQLEEKLQLEFFETTPGVRRIPTVVIPVFTSVVGGVVTVVGGIIGGTAYVATSAAGAALKVLGCGGEKLLVLAGVDQNNLNSIDCSAKDTLEAHANFLKSVGSAYEEKISQVSQLIVDDAEYSDQMVVAIPIFKAVLEKNQDKLTFPISGKDAIQLENALY